ncbi:MAG: class I SAM-dependent methyltransferase [candidate division Zixibacteria bacterium]|nr:class I SAM-dependent methyltransferase [candidate division Zixibacteria bacterium]
MNFADPEIQKHFNVTSYTVPEREEQMRSARTEFFRSIIDLASRCANAPATGPRVLDIGVAYGHLIELYRETGAECTALEIVDQLRERLLAKGYAAYKTALEIPADARFDVITAIDSFYYFEQPVELLRELRPHLKSEGVLIIRLANRTPVFRLLQMLGRPISRDLFGDVKHNFTYGAIRLLLEKTGYRIERTVLTEKGKKGMPFPKWLYYKLSPAVSRITGMKLTPGMILVCRGRDTKE